MHCMPAQVTYYTDRALLACWGLLPRPTPDQQRFDVWMTGQLTNCSTPGLGRRAQVSSVLPVGGRSALLVSWS